MIETGRYIKRLYYIIALIFTTSMCYTQQTCVPLTLDDITDPGTYTTSSYVESDGIRNGPDYAGSTIYYPTNKTTPSPGIIIIPGFTAAQSSIADWGPFLASHGIITMTIGTNSLLDFPQARRDGLLDAIISLKDENTRVNSPLIGAVQVNNIAVGGWSMGGGGAQLAATADPSIKAVLALCPWLNPVGLSSSDLNHSVPVLIFGGEVDPTAPPAAHAVTHYNFTPQSTDKLLYVIENGNHSVANSPTGGGGLVGQIGVSWLNHHLGSDNCYCPLYIDEPSNSTVYNTTVVCPLIILPVEITKFSGYHAENQNYLEWETATEDDNLGFHVESSFNGKKWRAIGTVEGNGTTTDYSRYHFIHKNPSTDDHYYRLKQVDYDGDYQYSNVISIEIWEQKEIIISPNPTEGVFSITGIREGDIIIYNASGDVLKETTIGDDEINISTLPNGLLILRIITDNQTFTRRIIKH